MVVSQGSQVQVLLAVGSAGGRVGGDGGWGNENLGRGSEDISGRSAIMEKGGILAGRYSGDYFLMVGKEFLRAMVSTRVGGKRGEKITLDSFFGGDVGEGKCCRRPEAELILHGWMPEYT